MGEGVDVVRYVVLRYSLLCTDITSLFITFPLIILMCQDLCSWVHEKPKAISFALHSFLVEIKCVTHLSVEVCWLELVARGEVQVKDVLPHHGHVAGIGAERDESDRDSVSPFVF